MNLKESAQFVFDTCKELGDDLEVTFDSKEVTVFWENLRFDVVPADLEKVLRVIREAKKLGATSC